MYLFFFASGRIIDKATTTKAWLEAPVYVLLAMVLFWQLRTEHIKDGVSGLFSACAKRCSSTTSKHFLVSLIQPMSKLFNAIFLFFAINTLANAFPSTFKWKPPKQWDFLTWFFGAKAMADGILTGSEIEQAFRLRSVNIMDAVIVTCFSWFVFKVKSPPKRVDNTGEDNFLTWYWTALRGRQGLAPLVDFAIGATFVWLTAITWMHAFGINARAVLAFGGIGGLAFGLAAQELVSNLISGLLLLATNPFRLGDYINTSSVEGYVRSVGWNFTTIETRQGPMIYIPNGSVLSETTKNRSGGNTRLMTIALPVRFPEGGFDRIDELVKGIQAVTAKVPEISDRVVSKADVLFKGIDVSSLSPLPMLEVEVRLDNRYLQSIRKQQSAVTLALVQYLRREGCTFPGLESSTPEVEPRFRLIPW